MNYAIILAGGVGSRFDDELPKQFHLLGNKPVLIHTIEKFLNYPDKIEIIVAINKQYIEYTNNLINKYLNIDINISEGGKTRSESLINACKYIEKNFKTSKDDIIITHDADRPFINNRIIKENIENLKYANAVSTAIETNNSILELEENTNKIIKVPIRKNMKIVQTPQTFKLKEFIDNYNLLTEDEVESLVEATKSYVIKGKK